MICYYINPFEKENPATSNGVYFDDNGSRHADGMRYPKAWQILLNEFKVTQNDFFTIFFF